MLRRDGANRGTATAKHSLMAAVLIVSFIVVSTPIVVVGVATAPGLYTYDSLVQLSQAQDRNYFDWNPPVMAAVWSFLISMTGSFSSLFWAQLCMLDCGLMLFAYVFWRSRLWGALIGLVAFSCSPFLLNFAGVVWKDVGMTFAFLIAFGVVAVAHILRRGTGFAAIVALPFVLYAVAVRYNALPAILPLFFMFIWISSNTNWPRRICLSVIGTVVAAAGVLIVVHLLVYDYLGATRQFPGQFIPLYDLAGLSVRTGTDLIPHFAKGQDFSMERLKAAYTPVTGDYLFREPSVLRASRDAVEVADVRQAWLHEIAGHPVIYLEHRWDVFCSLLRIGENRSFFIYVDRTLSETELRAHGEIPQRFAWSGATYAFIDYLVRATDKHTPAFRGWFWAAILVALSILGAVLASVSRRGPLAETSICLSCSGIFYMLPYFFVAPASDFRYLYWCVVSASLAGVIAIGMAVDHVSSLPFWARNHAMKGVPLNRKVTGYPLES